MALNKFSKHIVLLIIILAVAGFFRLWQLDKIPPGIYPDEAMNANDALTNPGKVFYPENNGREGLFNNLTALSFWIFGISVWSFKIVPAIIGILTVFGLYLLTKELFKKNTALLASFLLAVSFWHVNFSRIQFRAIMLPLILTFASYFLFRGFRTNRFWNFILAGIIYGAGFYTYISFRLSILLVIVLFICFLAIRLKEKKELKKFFAESALFALLVFITALPIGLYFLGNPDYFVSRATGVSVFSQTDPFNSFLKSFVVHLGMFNFYGDPNWRHNFAGSPQLNWFEGILFLAGIFFLIKNSIKIGWLKIFFLLSWVLIMLLPGILTYEGIPHALRTIGVIPAVYILAGFGGWQIYKLLSQKINGKILIPVCMVLLAGLLGFQFQKYFITWANRPEVKHAFTQKYNAIGYYLNSLPDETQKYVIVNEWGSRLYGISIPAQTPQFIERIGYGKIRASYIKTDELDKIRPGMETVIVPLYDGRLFGELQKNFPQGEKINKDLFDIYYIND